VRRRAGILFILGATVPLVALVSSAWACGVLATLKAAPSTVAPGATVQVTGSNYSRDADKGLFAPVSIRLDSRTGPELGTAEPTGTKISANVKVPATAAAGDHLLVATQTRISDGTPKSGTPGRTTIRVGGAAVAASTTPAASPWSSSNPSASGGSTASADPRGSGDPGLLGIGLSLALLSIGLVLVTRDRATRGPRRTLLGA